MVELPTLLRGGMSNLIECATSSAAEGRKG